MKLLRLLTTAVFLLTCSAPNTSFAISEIVNLDRAKRGNVAFTHQRHAYRYDIACERCHHNIGQIQAGETTCKGCHKNKAHSGLCHTCHLSSRDSDYAVRNRRIEEELQKTNLPTLFKAFHNLCRNCHADANDQDKKAAPYECGGCHI